MSRETATPGHRKFRFHHTFLRPARTISAEGCSHPRHICISRHIWASRQRRSPQRVARTQDTFAFHDTFGRPGRQDLRRELLAPKTHLHFTTHLGVPAHTISAEGCSHPRHICISRHIRASWHARSPQRVARAPQDTFAFHGTFGRPGTQDLRRGLLAPKTHLHFMTHLRPGTQDLRRGLLALKTHLHFTTHLGLPAETISADGCSHPRHICISRCNWASRQARSPQRVARTQDTFAFHDTFGRPGTHDLRRGLLAPKTHLHFMTHLGVPAVPAHTISAEGCSHPRHICILRHIWASRHARSPQRVARTQDTFAFHDTFGSPGTHDLRRGLLAPKTHLHFTTQLGIPAGKISAEGCSHTRHICISRHIWASRQTRSPQRVARTQDTFAFHDTFGRPGGGDLRRGLLAPKRHLHHTRSPQRLART